MALWYECPNCGASLDPGEQCDCQREGIANIFMQLPESSQDKILEVMRELVASSEKVIASSNC